MHNSASAVNFINMPPRPRPLTEHDRTEWANYVRSVSAFAGREIKLPPTAVENTKTTPVPQPKKSPAPRPRAGPTPLVTGQHPPGLDKSTWNRFSTGKLPSARTLDLHGKTAQSAFHALERFLHTAHAEQLRCVEIITGRGTGEHGGVIRRELPHWLNLPALRPLVLAASHPHALNPGSTRVLLRRTKPIKL
jgi:DNA-nicking Smr family endonuclease